MIIDKSYQPSNGSEGDWFTDSFCMNCIHCDPNLEGKKQCEILCNALMYTIDEPGYPKEWVYDDEDKPTCTKWKQWNWEVNGDPDDRDNPNAPTPFNPNQLTMQF